MTAMGVVLRMAATVAVVFVAGWILFFVRGMVRGLRQGFARLEAALAASPTRAERAALHHALARSWRPVVYGANVLFFLLAAAGIAVMLQAETKAPAIVLVFAWPGFVLARRARGRRAAHLGAAAGYALPSAEDALEEVRRTGAGFALFLRGFDAELRARTSAGFLIEGGERQASLEARDVEAAVVPMLEGVLPVVALADPRDPQPTAGALRFTEPPSDWLALVRGLVAEASLVVVYLTAFSEGLLKELELIRGLGATRKTVLIVGRKLKARTGERDALAGWDHVVRESSGRFVAELHAALAAAAGRALGPIPKRSARVTGALLRLLRYLAGPAVAATIVAFFVPKEWDVPYPAAWLLIVAAVVVAQVLLATNTRTYRAMTRRRKTRTPLDGGRA